MKYCLLLGILLILSCQLNAADVPAFKEQTIEENIGKVCYAVTIADVNGDQHQDVVAVSENRVVWYENPNWRPHIIIQDQVPLDHVCIAPHDIDRDGKIDFALGAGWTKSGTLHWLKRRQSLKDQWQVFQFGESRWLHRMRWANVLGKQEPQLVISPLNAVNSNGVELTAFEIPKHPETDRWTANLIDASLNRMHNHWHADVNKDNRIDTLTASREGIWLHQFQANEFAKVKLGDGVVNDEPNQSGAGEIKTGSLRGGVNFITTVEPMHGHTVAIYVRQNDDSWSRHIIATGFKRGHALWTADMDQDGSDEIIFGHSDTPETFGVIVFKAIDNSGTAWTSHVIDGGGMACEDLIVEDLNQDKRPDIIAGGRATHNVKIYWNQGK